MSEKSRLLDLIKQLQREVKDIGNRLNSLEERVAAFDGYELVEGEALQSGSACLPIQSDPAPSVIVAPLALNPPQASFGHSGARLPSDLEREDAARETGRFFQRALVGLPRGDSGRSRVKLQNNFYVVVRGVDGTVYKNPVKVFSRFNLCRPFIVAPGGGKDFGCSIFAGFCDTWEAKLAVEEAGLVWPTSISNN